MNEMMYYNIINLEDGKVFAEDVSENYIRNFVYDLIEDRSGIDDSIGRGYRKVIDKGFRNFTFLEAHQTLGNWNFKLQYTN